MNEQELAKKLAGLSAFAEHVNNCRRIDVETYITGLEQQVRKDILEREWHHAIERGDHKHAINLQALGVGVLDAIRRYRDEEAHDREAGEGTDLR